MSRNSTETSTFFFSSSVALGFCSSSRWTASGHELRQLALELLQQRQSLARLLQMLQRGGQLGVLALQIVAGRGQPRGHLVEGGAELADLVAGAHGRPRLEVAGADATGGAGELAERAHHDAAHGHGQHAAGGHDRQAADEELAVAMAARPRRARAPSRSPRAPPRAPCGRCRGSPGTSPGSAIG